MSLTATSSLISSDEALELVDTVIKQSEADGVFVSFAQEESALSRFSENQISQNVSRDRARLTITSYYGHRSASAATSELDPDAIKRTLERSQTLARIAPEDPEWTPLLSPQTYADRIPAFDEETALFSPIPRGEIVQRVCQSCRDAGVEGSGTLSTSLELQAVGNSEGLRVRDRVTDAQFSFTAKIDNGSSWNSRTAWGIKQLPIDEMTKKVISRAIQSRQPREIKPGTYPVILDPAAFSSLLPWVIWNLDARSADEGRSFMSKIDENGKPVGNKVGEQLFSKLVQVQRNPAHPLLQLERFFSDGMANAPLNLITDGIPQTLSYSRYWAQEKGTDPTGSFYPLVMAGSDQSLADLIANTEQGILMSRAWYVRYVNPRTLEVTGMTRDGTFWIEDGKIAYPLKNLRFNQNLPEMLNQIDAVSQVQRFGSSVVPGVRVKAFNFSSVTDSI
jgi:predicted Zn-dependent protease